jgi:hypothetical protein
MRRKRSALPPTLGRESYSSLEQMRLSQKASQMAKHPPTTALPDVMPARYVQLAMDDGDEQLPGWSCPALSHLGSEVMGALHNDFNEVWLKHPRTLRITTIQPKEQYL